MVFGKQVVINGIIVEGLVYNLKTDTLVFTNEPYTLNKTVDLADELSLGIRLFKEVVTGEVEGEPTLAEFLANKFGGYNDHDEISREDMTIKMWLSAIGNIVQPTKHNAMFQRLEDTDIRIGFDPYLYTHEDGYDIETLGDFCIVYSEDDKRYISVRDYIITISGLDAVNIIDYIVATKNK